MDQPLYIAPDEEIISVIARLRSLPDAAVTLVFPKHSVVTQSIINLKLLAREGEKLQKTLTLVSQNENARSLAEKIGFATLPYTQEMEKGNLVIPPAAEEVFSPPLASIPDSSIQEKPGSESPRLKSSDIGSQSFYSPVLAPEVKKMGDIKPQVEAEAVPPSPEPPTSLRVRNLSPERTPSLNSLRTPAEDSLGDLSVKSTVSAPIFPDNHVQSTPTPNLGWQTGNTSSPTAIKEFFSRGENSQASSVRMPQSREEKIQPVPFITKNDVPKKTKPVLVSNGTSSKLRVLLFALVFLFIASIGALLFFLVFPSAQVSIAPQTLNESHDQSFTLNLAASDGEIPIQKSTREVTAKVAGIASGASGSTANGGSRAKGTIKISNNYSNEAQTLVSSTRFESAAGKIYRIQENITVPGNGSIEAAVVADGSGESYNMNEGTFTIPGFKGSDKYEKFTAVLVGSMSGGEGAETASGGTFIRADEETLRGRALEEAKRIFAEESNTDGGDTYTFTDGLLAERVTETNLPKIGSVPGEYEYSAVFKITAFTTSQEAVTQAMVKNIRSQYDGVAFTPTTQELSFTDFSVNEKGDQAEMKAHLDMTLAAAIDEEKIKADLAGKSAADLENFTTEHPEVKGLSISFYPSWALKRIPNNVEKIKLSIEP